MRYDARKAPAVPPIRPPDDDDDEEFERLIRDLAAGFPATRSEECLYCYLHRMLGRFGCDGTHEWTERWRDQQAKPFEWLLDSVKGRGGCCCDCEVVYNVFRDDRTSPRHRLLRCAASRRQAG